MKYAFREKELRGYRGDVRNVVKVASRRRWRLHAEESNTTWRCWKRRGGAAKITDEDGAAKKRTVCGFWHREKNCHR